MKHANFSALGEKVNFDDNGDPIAYYDLLNWQSRPDGSLNLIKVGFYDASLPAGQSLVINDSVIQWPVGKQVCSLQTGLRPCLPLRLLYVLLINITANLFLFMCTFKQAEENVTIKYNLLKLTSITILQPLSQHCDNNFSIITM